MTLKDLVSSMVRKKGIPLKGSSWPYQALKGPYKAHKGFIKPLRALKVLNALKGLIRPLRPL